MDGAGRSQPHGRGKRLLKDARHLIVDGDPLYTAHFKEILASANVQLLRMPARSPNLNAYAERFVGSLKSERLCHIVPVGERHLRAVVREYVAHYTTSAITKASTTSSPCRSPNTARERQKRLGGVLGHYRREPA